MYQNSFIQIMSSAAAFVASPVTSSRVDRCVSVASVSVSPVSVYETKVDTEGHTESPTGALKAGSQSTMTSLSG